MKYVNLLIGFVIFSLITFIFFNSAYVIGKDYDSRDFNTYQNLTNNYNFIGNLTGDKSDIQGIKSKLTPAEFLTNIIPGAKEALEAGKLIFNSIFVPKAVTRQVVDSLGLPEIVYTSIVGIFFILLIIITFIVIRGVKPDTD